MSKDVICVDRNDKGNKGDVDMTVAEIRKKIKLKNHSKKIPHLNSVNGKVKIDSKDPKQVKWFDKFKK